MLKASHELLFNVSCLFITKLGFLPYSPCYIYLGYMAKLYDYMAIIYYIYNNNQDCDSPVSASHILVLQVCAISPSSPLVFAGNTSVFETRSPRCWGVYKLRIETGLDTARETKEVFISEVNAKIHGDKSTMQSRVLILKR